MKSRHSATPTVPAAPVFVGDPIPVVPSNPLLIWRESAAHASASTVSLASVGSVASVVYSGFATPHETPLGVGQFDALGVYSAVNWREEEEEIWPREYEEEEIWRGSTKRRKKRAKSPLRQGSRNFSHRNVLGQTRLSSYRFV